jgi:hypothetical protein
MKSRHCRRNSSLRHEAKESMRMASKQRVKRPRPADRLPRRTFVVGVVCQTGLRINGMRRSRCSSSRTRARSCKSFCPTPDRRGSPSEILFASLDSAQIQSGLRMATISGKKPLEGVACSSGGSRVKRASRLSLLEQKTRARRPSHLDQACAVDPPMRIRLARITDAYATFGRYLLG